MNIVSKKLRGITIYVKAQEAVVKPPIGPMLGQFAIDVKAFCDNFNRETAEYDKGILLKVIITLYKDATIDYQIKSSPLFFLLELSSFDLSLKYSYKDYAGISLYCIYLITLIKNKEYDLINIEYLLNHIIKAAKRSKYKIIEKYDDTYYYLYI